MIEKKLELVRDVPAFEKEYKQDRDKFNHKVYADTIFKIVEDNPAPLVLGLLGPWGCGKSTILNLFQNKIETSHDVVYFNAWKYANDSFRRQFLIETANCLIKNEKERRKIISDFNNRFLKDLKNEFESLEDLLTTVKKKVKIYIPGFISFSIVSIAVLIIIAFGYGIFRKNPTAIYSSLFASVPLGLLLKHLIERLLPGLFKIEVDPKIILPEQFEEEFAALVKRANKDKIVFVIDDIDRCPDHMILEILDSAKTFFAFSNDQRGAVSLQKEKRILRKCYFIIAIDDKAVTSVLQRERGKNYQNEEVLKFFDATVRLNPISHSDLIEFSKHVAEDANIPKEAVQIAIYGGLDTPRKIKHFLNAYKIIYSIVEKRKKDGIFSLETEKILSSLSKILVLQIAFPKEFEELKNNAKLLDVWEKQSQEEFKIYKGTQNLSLQIDNSQKKKDVNIKLLRFLWATKHTPISDLEAFLHLKLPSYAGDLPNYSEFRNAVFYNELPKKKELLEKIKSEKEKDSAIALIRDLLDREPDEFFLVNTLSSALELYKNVNFDKSDKKHLSDIIIKHVERHQKVLTFNPKIIFDIVNNLTQKERQEGKIIELGVKDLARKPVFNYTGEFISLLYLKDKLESKKLAKEINDNLNNLAEKDPKWVIEILKLIDLPKDKEWSKFKNKVPTPKIISEKMLTLLSEKDAEVAFYEEVFGVIVKFWDDSFTAPLSDKCVHIVSYWNQQSLSSLNSILKLTLKIIIDMPKWIDESKSDELSNQIQALYGRLSDLNEKRETLEAYSVVGFSSKSRQNYISKIVNYFSNFDMENFKEFIKFVESYEEDDKWWTELKNQMSQHVLSTIQGSPDENNLKRFDFVYKRKGIAITEDNIKNILNNVFPNQQYAEIWEKEILKISKNKALAEWIIVQIKSLLVNNTSLSDDHKDKLFDIATEVIKQIGDETKNVEIGNFIFELANNVDKPQLMTLGINRLKLAKDLLGGLFSTKLNTETQSICSRNENEITKYKDLLKAFLAFQDEWTDETYKLFVDALSRLIKLKTQENIDLAFGLFSNTKKEKIPKGKIKSLKDSIKLIDSSTETDRWKGLLK